MCLSASTDEGVVRRNTMHFRVKADAFVPAGGRPNTINAGNERVNISVLPFDTNVQYVLSMYNMLFYVLTTLIICQALPSSIYAPDNWHLFLDENNVPSSPLIVEGANIFITADARTKLFEVGKVAIVKDSSANKVGFTYICIQHTYIHTCSVALYFDLRQAVASSIL